jgi:hypothetical protein
MSRNDIRLRRQRLSGGASRFRNYGNVLDRHEKEVRIKKLIRVFSYFAIILIVVMLIVILWRAEKKFEENSPSEGRLPQDKSGEVVKLVRLWGYLN